MIDDTNTTDRRELIRQQILALEHELEKLSAAPTAVDEMIEHNRNRADAPNALRPNRRTP